MFPRWLGDGPFWVNAEILTAPSLEALNPPMEPELLILMEPVGWDSNG